MNSVLLIDTDVNATHKYGTKFSSLERTMFIILSHNLTN